DHRYFVGIESKNRALTGDYEIHVRQYDPANAPGSSGTDGPPTPLSGWGNILGVTIRLNNDRGSSAGSIDDPDEVDWYTVENVHAGYLQVTVAGVNDDLKEFVTPRML